MEARDREKLTRSRTSIEGGITFNPGYAIITEEELECAEAYLQRQNIDVPPSNFDPSKPVCICHDITIDGQVCRAYNAGCRVCNPMASRVPGAPVKFTAKPVTKRDERIRKGYIERDPVVCGNISGNLVKKGKE